MDAEKVSLKTLLNELLATKTTELKEQILCNIQRAWKNLHLRENIADILQGNILLQTVAEILEEKFETWKNEFPVWVSSLLDYAKEYDDVFSLSQKTALYMKFRKYIMGEHWSCLRSFSLFVSMPSVQQVLLKDNKLYGQLNQVEIEVPYLTRFYQNITNECEEWQLKILYDKDLVLKLLAAAHWEDIFANLAQHPDAKTLLPLEKVLDKATQESNEASTMIVALLCSDADLAKFNLEESWIKHITDTLASLVQTGYGTDQTGAIYNLLEIVLQIANLSVVDTFKEVLGGKSVEMLLKIITEELPNVQYVQPHLQRSRQEASRALGNFVFNEVNCKLIRDANGVDKLKAALTQIDDSIVKKNITGILYQIDPPHIVDSRASTPTNGHVMISYNWANQSTVLRITKSLQERGYDVWVDIERMGGSTLEAMAHAIEEAGLVLMCMSQKYKDSANCRLEGEYCVNRKMKFIPLMMQSEYKPDGWLGLALGSKLYYDFSNEENWDDKITALVKAISHSGYDSTEPNKPATKVTGLHKKPVITWTTDDIYEWMKNEGIEQHYEMFKKHKFTGRALLELKQIHLQNPMFIFQFLREFGFSITEGGVVLELCAAIRKL